MKKLNFFQNKPKASKIDVDSYLKKIGVTAKSPSLTYLRELQKAHLLSIPYENLDIHYGSKIVLDYQKIFEKIVVRNRGGLSYELNGLFYHLLYHLGFDCHIISAKKWEQEKKQFGQSFDHMSLIVGIQEEHWMVDVGFDDGPISPLKIKKGEIQMDYTRYWKFDTDFDDNYILKVSEDASHFYTRILFTPKEKQFIQFIEICEFHQTSRDSLFTQQKIITILTSTGRITLTDKILKILDFAQTHELALMNEDEFLAKLEYHFGIKHQQLIPKRR